MLPNDPALRGCSEGGQEFGRVGQSGWIAERGSPLRRPARNDPECVPDPLGTLEGEAKEGFLAGARDLQVRRLQQAFPPARGQLAGACCCAKHGRHVGLNAADGGDPEDDLRVARASGTILV